jgi:hypothetical protein
MIQSASTLLNEVVEEIVWSIIFIFTIPYEWWRFTLKSFSIIVTVECYKMGPIRFNMSTVSLFVMKERKKLSTVAFLLVISEYLWLSTFCSCVMTCRPVTGTTVRLITALQLAELPQNSQRGDHNKTDINVKTSLGYDGNCEKKCILFIQIISRTTSLSTVPNMWVTV